MNHIAAWQEATLEALPVLLKGDKLPAGQYSIQKFNALHYAADQDRSLTASQRRLSRSRHKLLAFLASVPETQLLNLKSRVGVWVKYATYGPALKNTPTPGSEQIQAAPLASRRLEAGRNPLTQPRGPRG
jgi:hypothetical protein